MKPDKVQWLQRMGIEVWRLRAHENSLVPPVSDGTHQGISEVETTSSSSTTKNIEDHSPLTKIESETTSSRVHRTKESVPTSHDRARIDVWCSACGGLLIVKDNGVFDRDFSDDIFRAFRLLHNLSTQQSEPLFFDFHWSPNTQLDRIISANDQSSAGAQRAFRAMARSHCTTDITHLVCVGNGATPLSDGELFPGARVWTHPDEPISSEFKQSLWNFLRNAQ